MQLEMRWSSPSAPSLALLPGAPLLLGPTPDPRSPLATADVLRSLSAATAARAVAPNPDASRLVGHTLERSKASSRCCRMRFCRRCHIGKLAKSSAVSCSWLASVSTSSLEAAGVADRSLSWLPRNCPDLDLSFRLSTANSPPPAFPVGSLQQFAAHIAYLLKNHVTGAYCIPSKGAFLQVNRNSSLFAQDERYQAIYISGIVPVPQSLSLSESLGALLEMPSLSSG